MAILIEHEAEKSLFQGSVDKMTHNWTRAAIGRAGKEDIRMDFGWWKQF
jgi:hypothetical protein